VGETTIDLMTLPSTQSYPTFPDGSIDWRRLGIPIEAYRTPEGTITWDIPASMKAYGQQGVSSFLSQYQGALMLAGAAVLVLLLLGRRR